MLEDHQLAEDFRASASTIKALDVSDKIVIDMNDPKVKLQDLEESQQLIRPVDDYTSGVAPPQSVIVKNKNSSE